MVGKVDALASVRLAIDPADREAAEKLGQQHNRVAGERHADSLVGQVSENR